MENKEKKMKKRNCTKDDALRASVTFLFCHWFRDRDNRSYEEGLVIEYLLRKLWNSNSNLLTLACLDPNVLREAKKLMLKETDILKYCETFYDIRDYLTKDGEEINK